VTWPGAQRQVQPDRFCPSAWYRLAVTTVTSDRNLGLEFGSLEAALDGESYPLTTAELLGAYGEREIEHANGAATLQSILDPQDEETYDSAGEVRQSILNMIGDEAIGRKFYSDRETNDTELGYEEQSF
jgi:hypothetical protein